MKFLLSIAKNDELRTELKILSNLIRGCDCTPGSANYKKLCSQLNKVMTDFELPKLEHKICFLKLLSGKMEFATIKAGYVTFVERDDNSSRMEFCEDVWFFYDIVHDTNFRQVFINEAINEVGKPFSEKFRKDMSEYIELSQEGKDIASRHFEKKIAFQAYCEETDNANMALNVNLINYDGNEPIRISDILRQEEDVDELNIYCKSKCEVRAFRGENNKRHYGFEKGAYYQMTSTWPIKDESGRVTFTCIMVMDVSSEGITEAKFSGKKPNGESCELSLEKDKGLIKQNEELYIGNLSLCEAVEEFLKKQHGLGCGGEDIAPINSALPPDVVPGGNVGGNPTSNSGASTPTGVNLQGNGIHRETDLQQQKIDELVQGNQELRNKLNEVNSMMNGLMQNFEGLKDGAQHRNELQDARTDKLEGRRVRRKG